MTDRARSTRSVPAVLRVIVSRPITVWVAFIAVHLWLGLLNLYAPGFPLGDVTLVYKFWTDQALSADFWVGIDSMWVYPIVALVPMLVSAAFGSTFYASTWLTMIMVLNAVAFAVLTGWGRSRVNIAVAWWWVAFLVLLGPIALGRVDSVTVPVALVGLLLLSSRPKAAAVLLTIATWIKVWPAAILGAILVASRDRWRVVATAAVTSIAIVATALWLGSGANVFSFFTEQADRGLQIESPVSTIWLWQVFAGVPETFIYYDRQILTYQVEGAGVDVASAIMTPLLAVVAVGLCFLGGWANRNRAPVTEVLPLLTLALVTALIAFNKVGSPQFMAWLAVPVIFGLATNAAGHGRSFRIPAILVLVMAGLTQVIYPYLYGLLLNAHPLLLITVTARNMVLFVLLGWAIVALVGVARPGARHESLDESEEWLPALWAPTHRQATAETVKE
jgi:hypothetical protein